MLSIDAFRHQVDANFERAIDDYQMISTEIDDLSPNDLHLFDQASRQVAVASWAANQEVVLTHNLVKALIDEIR